MIEQLKDRKWTVLAIIVVLVVMWIRVGGHGPMNPDKAHELFTNLLQSERSNPRSVPLAVVAPDGFAVHVPPKLLRGPRLVECAKTDGRMGSTPGLYGQHNRTQAVSKHACLFRMTGPSGVTLHMGLDVFRQGRSGADAFSGFFAPASATKRMIKRFQAPMGQISPAQRDALNELKGEKKRSKSGVISTQKPDWGAEVLKLVD